MNLERRRSGTLCLFDVAVMAAISFLFAAPTGVRAGDWPGWRGSTGLGLTDEKDLPLTWDGKSGANVLWKATLPGTEGKERRDNNQSSPIVSRGHVFVASAFWPAGVVPEKTFPEHHLTCFGAGDGKQLWDTLVPPGPWLLKDLRGGYSAPTPAADGERVYVLFGSSVLAALDFAGKIVWRNEIIPYTFDVCIGTSPVLFEDTVILLCSMANKKDSGVKAFDKVTGKLKWESNRPTMGFAHTTPVIIEVKGKPLMVISASGAGLTPDAILGMDPVDGKVIWWCKGTGDVPTPASGSGLIFAVDGRGNMGTAVDPAGAGDVTGTHLKWTIPKIPDGTFSSPVIVGDFLYQLQASGVLKCWKVRTGEMVFATERLPGVSVRSSPIVTPEGRLYFASAGKTYVFQQGPKPEVLAVNDLEDASETSAAAAGGRLYLKGRRFIHCVGKK